MTRKLLIWGTIILPIGIILYGMRPIYNPSLESCEITEGQIMKLHEGGEFDLVVRLQEDPKSLYYINRGLEHSFDLNKVQEWKHGQARIWYVDRWVLRTLGNTSWHIARLDIESQTVFDESTNPNTN